MPLNTQTQYEQLPYLETVDDVAKFVISMVTDKQQIYMDGIREALEGMEFLPAQIGLLDKYASPKLSKKLDAHLCGENKEAIPAHLEKAFWEPMVAAAHQILDPAPMGDMSANQSRNLCTALLYASMQANISNVKLLMQTNLPQSEEPKNSDILVAQFEGANIYQVHTAMPATHTLRVLQKGVMPQFLRAIEHEMGMDSTKMAKVQKEIFTLWEADPAKTSSNELLRPLNAFEWMRFSRPKAEFIQQESEVAYKDSCKLLPPPHVPEV